MKLCNHVAAPTRRSPRHLFNLELFPVVAFFAAMLAQHQAGGQGLIKHQAASLKFIREVRTNPKDGLSYSWIPPGTFTMGCSAGDPDCFADEKPAHKVTLSAGFWLSRTEVTIRAYKRFAGVPDNLGVSDGSDQMPVVDVTWAEAEDYCKWVGGRLPTEAEWEYAARAGNSAPLYGDLDQISWYEANSLGFGHPVGRKLANRFGLFDMLGNVWEWVDDWYSPVYYSQTVVTDPQGPPSGQMRVLRGGSWLNPHSLIRASDRARSDPEVRFNYFGFRCVWLPTDAKL